MKPLEVWGSWPLVVWIEGFGSFREFSFFVRETIFVWFVSRGFSGLFSMSSDDA